MNGLHPMESLLLWEVISEVLSLRPDLQDSPQIFRALERTTLKPGISCWSLKESSQLGKGPCLGRSLLPAPPTGNKDSVVAGEDSGISTCSPGLAPLFLWLVLRRRDKSITFEYEWTEPGVSLGSALTQPWGERTGLRTELCLGTY